MVHDQEVFWKIPLYIFFVIFNAFIDSILFTVIKANKKKEGWLI